MLFQYVLYKQSNEQLKLLQCKSQQYTYTDNINNTILNIQTPANTTIVNPYITLDIDFVNINSTLTIDSLPAGVTGVRLVVLATGKSNVQVGISGITAEIAK